MKLALLGLLLSITAQAEVPVSKYDEDLTRLPVADISINLYKDVRDNARKNLAEQNQRNLIDESYDEQNCLKACNTGNKGASCINDCVQKSILVLRNDQVQAKHEVDCTGKHDH